MSGRGVLLAAALLVALRAADARAAPPDDGGAAGATPRLTLSIVGTNDLHGHITALPALGGYLANLRAARARDGGAVLVLDGGDMFQGTLASNLGEGAAVVRAYNQLGYAAAAVGNHELDFGPVGPAPSPREPGDDPRGALKARAAEAKFPFLAANLVDAATGAPLAWPNVRPTAMLDLQGLKIGVVGVTTIATPRTVLASNFVGLAIRPLLPVVAAAAQDLRRRGATVVLVAAHAGGACPRFDMPDDLHGCEGDAEIFQLARGLPAGAVDAIIAGHTHEGLAHRVAGIPIIEAFAEGRAFGRVDLEIDRARGRVVGAKLHPPHRLEVGLPTDARYEGAPVVADVAVARAIAPALDAARAKQTERLGVSAVARVTRAYRTESALGNLFADLMRAAAPGADVAITNGGGLRADLPAGPLSYGDLFEAIPFDNSFATLRLTGAELASVIALNLARTGGILSVSGVRAAGRCVDGALSVTLTREDGRPIAPGEPLQLVTSNFLATGGDALFQDVAGKPVIDEGRLLRDAMAELLRARKQPLDPARLLRPDRPRLSFPGKRPVRCGPPVGR